MKRNIVVENRVGTDHLAANASVMECVGLILNPCSPDSATDACVSVSNYTNAIPGLASTMRTSLKPGNC